MKPKVIAVVGPTASGKTNLAVKIARKYNGEIISCDSRQVYRGLDEGTAKITAAEMNGITHHLLDICDIDTVYTATDFKRDATIAVADSTTRGKLPIVTGGTFFYLDQLRGTASSAPVPPNQKLRQILEEKLTTELYTELKAKDPTRAASIDPHNKRRLVRSLEIIAAIGNVPETQRKKIDSPYDFLVIGITTEKDVLRERFKARAEVWLTGPFQAEVETLLANGTTRARLQEIGFEYRIMLDYIDRKLTDEAFIQTNIEKNWQYAKQQKTWLKRDENIVWEEAGEQAKIFAHIEHFLS